MSSRHRLLVLIRTSPIPRHVSQHPSYGSFSLHTRTENKRTTLSALYMFVALASEGLNNIKKALQFCNKAIAEDPGWQIPFRKRSEYFSCLGNNNICVTFQPGLTDYLQSNISL